MSICGVLGTLSVGIAWWLFCCIQCADLSVWYIVHCTLAWSESGRPGGPQHVYTYFMYMYISDVPMHM